jgi:alkanesulfonate monooxygenase SsuD/methylene tetrahydromethanopterin reductase-like flavin-dependent oxidoreductase (luciferase family)
MMTGVRFGSTLAKLEEKLAGRSRDELRERGAIVGGPSEVREQIQEIGAAGVQRVMLQWLDLDDVQGIEALGRAVSA